MTTSSLTICLLILTFSVVNRGCGSDWFGKFTLARAVYFAPVFLFPVTYLASDALTAAVVSLGFVLWRFPAWRRWYILGRMEIEDKADWFEQAIERVTTQPHLAFMLRNIILLTPLAVLISPIFWALGIAIVAAYELAWRVYPQNPIFIAEYISGALWGLTLSLALLF